MPVVQTVGELRSFINDLPDNMPLMGYDGSDEQPPISVYVNNFDDVDDPSSIKPLPSLIIDLD